MNIRDWQRLTAQERKEMYFPDMLDYTGGPICYESMIEAYKNTEETMNQFKIMNSLKKHDLCILCKLFDK